MKEWVKKVAALAVTAALSIGVVACAAEGEAESNGELQVIKVDNFDELKKVHDTLQKPIIYSKVNDIKSMFIVEDEHSMYKYVLKKVDLEQFVFQ